MLHTVVGLFDNRTNASRATQELIQKGFLQENIDVSNKRLSDPSTSTQIIVTETGVSESISNFFGSLFGSDNKTAKNYTKVAGDADAIISVQVDSLERAKEAGEILDRHGAIDVDGRSNQLNQHDNQHNFTQTSEASPNVTFNQNGTTIPIIEEQLQVGKQTVERPGGRIRSRIIEKPVEASLRLREEHVVINRRPVNREVTEADLKSFRDGEIVLTEHAEVPVIGKQARVVEEIVIGKNVTEHIEVILETVRSTDVQVESVETDIADGDSTNNRDDLDTRRANG